MSKYFDGELLSAYEDLNKEFECKNKNVKLHQQIADLEAKLAESEIRSKESEIFYKREINRRDTKLRNIKQQLAEKENLIEDYSVFFNQLFNQDKISFAVEQLELLKYYIRLDNSDEETGDMPYVVDTDCLFELINNQIKQLKEKEQYGKI